MYPKHRQAVAVIILCAVSLCAQACEKQGPEPHERIGALGRYPMTADSMQQWKLPRRLREISGLAISAKGHLFAHADEEAIVYQLDYEKSNLIKAFALGDPTVRGDFEGLAVIGDEFFLTTSDGEIFRFAEGEDGDRVAYERMETGLGKHCEIEGLAAIGQQLLLLCKDVRSTKLIENLAIFFWDVSTESGPESVIELPEREILDTVKKKRINPSGLAVDPTTGNLLIVAAHQKVLLEITPTGELVQAMRMLLPRRHRQAEGIEVSLPGQLIISDEGGSHRARVAVYEPD